MDKKKIINYILIGLIVVFAVLLALQLIENNKMEDDFNEPLASQEPIETRPVTTLSSELFITDTLLLNFPDITLTISKPEVLDYYRGLTDNLENFKVMDTSKYIPSENIFELRFKDTNCSIYFYNDVTDGYVYTTVVDSTGAIIGNYLIPDVYYGNLFNIIYSSYDLTAHTNQQLKEQLPELMNAAEDVAIKLDENHIATDLTSLSSFEAMVKNKENTTVLYQLPDGQYLSICYQNYQYYVYLIDTDGNIVEEYQYQHYSLHKDGYIGCYIDFMDTTEENFVMDENVLLLKVVA